MSRIPDCHPEEKHKGLGLCVRCYKAQAANKAYSTAYGKEKQKQRTKKYLSTKNGKDKRKSYTKKEYYILARKNVDRSETTKRYKQLREKDPQVKAARKLYRQNNKGVLNALTANRRARKRQATLRGAFTKDTGKVYRRCPDGHEVDHIIPLSNTSPKDSVCGLHVPWNLQYLTKSDNSYKSDKFDGTYTNMSWRWR